MGKRGPQPKQINWDEFEKLVSYDCTQAEVASFFDISISWLEDLVEREYGVKLSVIWSKKKLLGRVKLRKLQFAIVERMGQGAATMAIYLDKKMLPHEQPGYVPPTQDPSLLLSGQTLNIKSFENFCVDAGYFNPYPKQIEMMSFVIHQSQVRLLLGARGYGKTDYGTIMGIAYDLYSAYKNGNDMSEHTNLIITKSKSRNAAIVQEISNALEKNGVPLEKSNSTIIRVHGLIGQDHSVEAITIKTSMRGRHPKRITMDDPVTDEDTSEAMRTLVKKKYDEAYKLCKNIVIIGQPAHAYDLYAELRDIILKMEVPHGTIPELDADLEAMKIAGIDQASIQMSYHLTIPVDGSMPFTKIKSIDVFPVGGCVAFIDPSDGGDHTAISIVKQYFDGIAVYGYQWKRAWFHCEEDLVKICVEKGVGKVCFETNMTGRNPLEQLRNLFGPHGIGVDGKRSDSNKHAIIMAAGSYAPMIYLSKDSDRSYTDHVKKYEYGAKYDDAPDSLARCMEWLGLIRGKS